METENEESESMVAHLRKIRDRIGLEIQDMTPEQVLEYFNQKEGLLPKSYWNKTDEPKQENK